MPSTTDARVAFRRSISSPIDPVASTTKCRSRSGASVGRAPGVRSTGASTSGPTSTVDVAGLAADPVAGRLALLLVVGGGGPGGGEDHGPAVGVGPHGGHHPPVGIEDVDHRAPHRAVVDVAHGDHPPGVDVERRQRDPLAPGLGPVEQVLLPAVAVVHPTGREGRVGGPRRGRLVGRPGDVVLGRRTAADLGRGRAPRSDPASPDDSAPPADAAGVRGGGRGPGGRGGGPVGGRPRAPAPDEGEDDGGHQGGGAEEAGRCVHGSCDAPSASWFPEPRSPSALEAEPTARPGPERPPPTTGRQRDQHRDGCRVATGDPGP